jgi:hypothetical protein
MQITIGRWSLATGLDWLLPKNAHETSEAKKGRKNDMFVLAGRTHMSWLGFHKNAAPGVHAAALLVGLVRQNAVVLHPVSDTMSWVCSIRDGMPTVGRDLVLPHADAENTARDWFGRGDGVTLIGENRGASIRLAAVLAEIEQSLGKTVRKSQVRAAALKPVAFPIKKAMQAGAAMAIVLVAAFAIGRYQSYPAKETGLESSTTNPQQQVEAATRAAEMVHAEKVNKDVQARQVAEIVARYSSRVSPVAFWNAVATLRSEIPVSMYGYRPLGQKCTPTSCAVDWRGQGRFVRLSDKLRLPNVEPNYTSEFAATSHFDIQAAPERLPDLKAMSPAALQLMIRSEMAIHYPTAQVADLKDVAVTPPPSTGLQPIVAAHAGSWSVQFTGPTALTSGTALAAALTKLPIALSAINYDKQAQRVEFHGEYAMLANAH